MLLSLIVMILILFIPFDINIRFQNNKENIILEVKIIINGIFQVRVDVLPIDLMKKSKFYHFIKGKLNKQSKEQDNLKNGETTSIKKIYNYLIKGYNMKNMAKAIGDYLARKLKIRSLIWITKIGTGDAAITGVATGFIWGLKHMIVAKILNEKKVDEIELDVIPEFNFQVLEIYFDCIIRFKLVYIIIAGFNGVRAKIKGGESNVRASN